jgi:chromosome segregation ATPase
LFKEVESLKKENADKEFALKSLDNECSDLKEKLDNIEEEHSNIVAGTKSLDEEIKDVEKNVFKCEECTHTFEFKSKLKLHMRNIHELVLWKSRLLEIETKNSMLKCKLSLDLFRMKELEMKDKESCSCRGFCAISHSKHNWTQSLCDEIFYQMEKPSSDGVGVNMNQCKTCEHIFPRPLDFIHHIESSH